MPRPAVYGLTALAFLAGFVLAGTLTLGSRTTDAAVEPTIGPCSVEWEHAYEVMRFARYSHTYWVDELAGGEVDPYSFNRAWHRWWADSYADVLTAIEGECVPEPVYPNLLELPGAWGSYPPRPTEGEPESR